MERFASYEPRAPGGVPGIVSNTAGTVLVVVVGARVVGVAEVDVVGMVEVEERGPSVVVVRLEEDPEHAARMRERASVVTSEARNRFLIEVKLMTQPNRQALMPWFESSR